MPTRRRTTSRRWSRSHRSGRLCSTRWPTRPTSPSTWLDRRLTEHVDVVVVGAGHTGLAASHFLSQQSIDHVVLERGDVANSWRRERWDSLRLLTPNWLGRLPGYRYEGADPDGFMTMSEVVAFVSRFAVVAAAPVRTHTRVTSVRRTDDGYHVATTEGDFHC